MNRDSAVLIVLLILTFLSGSLWNLPIPHNPADQTNKQENNAGQDESKNQSGANADQRSEQPSSNTYKGAYAEQLAPMFADIKFTDVLMTAFTGVLALLAYYQWQSMDAQRKLMQRQTKHMKSGLLLTRKSTAIAKDSVDIARRTLLQTQRAFMSLNEYKLEQLQDGWRATAELVNVGQTPANEVEILTGYVDRSRDQPHEFDLPSHDHNPSPKRFIASHGRVLGVPANFPIEKMEQIQRGDIATFVWISIRYRDVFEGTPYRFTKCCFKVVIEGDPRAEPRPGVTTVKIWFFAHSKHNEAT